MARAYAGGTPGWQGGDLRPIVVNVNGRKLFEIMKSRTLGYNVANNKRTPAGLLPGYGQLNLIGRKLLWLVRLRLTPKQRHSLRLSLLRFVRLGFTSG